MLRCADRKGRLLDHRGGFVVSAVLQSVRSILFTLFLCLCVYVLTTVWTTLDSLCWFSQRRSPTPHFWGRTQGAMTPKFERAKILVHCTYPQVSSFYVYSFGSCRVDKQTHRRRWKHPTLCATTLGNQCCEVALFEFPGVLDSGFLYIGLSENCNLCITNVWPRM